MFHCSTHLCLNLINKLNCARYFTSPFLHVFGVWTFGMWTLFFVMNNLFFTWEKLMNSVQTSLPSPPLGINNSCSSIIQIHVALYVYGKTFSLLLAIITLALWFLFFFGVEILHVDLWIGVDIYFLENWSSLLLLYTNLHVVFSYLFCSLGAM